MNPNLDDRNQCPWAQDVTCHVSSGNCRVYSSRDDEESSTAEENGEEVEASVSNIGTSEYVPKRIRNEEKDMRINKRRKCVHEFISTQYTTLFNKPGEVIAEKISTLDSCVNLYNFAPNHHKCAVRTIPFSVDNYVHLEKFAPRSESSFWATLTSVITMWDRVISEISSLNEKIQLWPSAITVRDAVIGSNVPLPDERLTLIYLRPCEFRQNTPDQFYIGIRDIIRFMFLNAYRNSSIHIPSTKIKSKLRCTPLRRRKIPSTKEEIDAPPEIRECCIPNGSGHLIYRLFGKNMFIHYILCTPEKFLNHKWYDFVRCLCLFKWEESGGRVEEAYADVENVEKPDDDRFRVEVTRGVTLNRREAMHVNNVTKMLKIWKLEFE